MRWKQVFEDMAESLRSLDRSVERIARSIEQPPTTGGFHFTVGPTLPKEGTSMPLTVTSTTAEQVEIKAVPNGGITGAVTTTVTAGAGTVTTVDDVTFRVVSEDVAGASSYLVSATNSAGATITDTIDYTYTAAGPPPATDLGLAVVTVLPK
jgi:hypothetical protein